MINEHNLLHKFIFSNQKKFFETSSSKIYNVETSKEDRELGVLSLSIFAIRIKKNISKCVFGQRSLKDSKYLNRL